MVRDSCIPSNSVTCKMNFRFFGDEDEGGSNGSFPQFNLLHAWDCVIHSQGYEADFPTMLRTTVMKGGQRLRFLLR